MGMESIVPFVAVAAGGALGALSRYSVYRVVETSFPWATFIVNVTGCLIASFLMFRYGSDIDSTTRLLIFTGFFGAYTTMSTFSIDTVNLMTEGSYAYAGANVLLNVVLCITGAACGRYLAMM